MKLKKKRGEMYTPEQIEAKKKSMGIAVHITPEGLVYKDAKAASYYYQLRMENRMVWKLKQEKKSGKVYEEKKL